MFMIFDFFRDQCLMIVDEIAIFSVLNFDVVTYHFLQRSAAIFALVDRQLNNQVTANGFRVNQCPTLALWTLITTFVNAKWLHPKPPYCQLLKQLASRVIYSLLTRQWSLHHISYIIGSDLSSTFSCTLQFDGYYARYSRNT